MRCDKRNPPFALPRAGRGFAPRKGRLNPPYSLAVLAAVPAASRHLHLAWRQRQPPPEERPIDTQAIHRCRSRRVVHPPWKRTPHTECDNKLKECEFY